MVDLLRALQEALSITSIVIGVMILLEFINVRSRGTWRERLIRSRRGQYLLAALLGAMPGCLGSFAVVSLYAHGAVSFGALVTAMFATAGDESFVMLAMIPREALVLHLLLLLLGMGVGVAADLLLRGRTVRQNGVCETALLHPTDEEPQQGVECSEPGSGLREWALRLGLFGFSAALVVGVLFGVVGPPLWNCVGIAMLTLALSGMAIIIRADGHFLRAHVWHHVVRQHVPRVFLWTLGALLVSDCVVTAMGQWVTAEGSGRWLLLLAAGLVGLIPESGPHLVFVTLFDRGLVPFSVLLTSSIVQDGHGMLPLLGESRRAFALVKLVNLAAGLLIGAVLMALGV